MMKYEYEWRRGNLTMGHMKLAVPLALIAGVFLTVGCGERQNAAALQRLAKQVDDRAAEIQKAVRETDNRLSPETYDASRSCESPAKPEPAEILRNMPK